MDAKLSSETVKLVCGNMGVSILPDVRANLATGDVAFYHRPW